MTEHKDLSAFGPSDFAGLDTAAHLWIVATGIPPEPDAAQSLADMFSAEERARHNRFHFEKDRDLFLVSHALVRSVLSRYCRISADACDFAAAPGGRPEIVNPCAVSMGLRFNLTHTDGLVACVVTSGADCGVDAERRRAISDLDDLANRVLHPREMTRFLATPASERLDKFLAFWTAKEACMKACGRGLSLAPESFALELSDNGLQARCLEVPDSLSWNINRLYPTPAHQLAVALDAATPRRVVVRYVKSTFC